MLHGTRVAPAKGDYHAGLPAQHFEIAVVGGNWAGEGSDLLAALGRMPNTEELKLPAAGVETDSRGFIKLNDRLERTAPGVWALGDVNGGPQFTHASLDHWRIVAANLAGGTGVPPTGWSRTRCSSTGNWGGSG